MVKGSNSAFNSSILKSLVVDIELAKKRETFKTHLEKGIIEISCNIPRFVIIGNA